MMSEIPSQLSTGLADRYAIERELGSGGMATVYLAEDLKHERKVAVKVLRPDLAAALGSERFLREIKIAAQLHHPHILPLHDSGEADGFLYYVMPYEEGQSLREKLEKEGELPVSEAVRLLRDVVDALAHAHKHGVVHRDIKPDNVLLSDRHALVTDFGVAKAVSEATGRQQLTTAGVALGTPAYMAPEQAVADPHIDHRADIYAVGALAYEVLTGRPPFSGPNPQAVLSAHVTDAPEPATRYRETVPQALNELVMRCLKKKPADRWQSAEELLPQLEALATPSVGVTPTDTQPVQAAASRRRRKTMSLAAAAALVIIAAYMVISRAIGPSESAAAERPRLVVLPFENLGAPEDEYFADGITDEITSRLGEIQELGVIGRTSANQYRGTDKPLRQIGEELTVDYVLEGAVRWQRSSEGPGRVRVTPQLIRVSDETHLWADRYDAVLADIFEVQSNIAAQVASAMGVALLEENPAADRRPTENLEAYDFYLRGKDYTGRNLAELDSRTAVQMFERAVELDANFAEAFAALARARVWLYWEFGDLDELPKAREALEKAQRLEGDLTDTRLASAYLSYYGARNFDRALEELAIVREREPNNSDVIAAIGYLHRRNGEWEKAVEAIKKAVELDPRDHGRIFTLGQTFALMRNYLEAERFLNRAISQSPNLQAPYRLLAQMYLNWDGQTDRALQVVQDIEHRFQPLSVGASLARVFATELSDCVAERLRDRCNPSTRTQVALQLGQSQMARTYYESLRTILADTTTYFEASLGTYHSTLGLAHARLGDHERALEHGQRAVELMPVSEDAFNGPGRLRTLVEILIMVGEYEAAIEQLDILLSIPSMISASLLRIDPLYDPLRDHPRFQALLAKYEN